MVIHTYHERVGRDQVGGDLLVRLVRAELFELDAHEPVEVETGSFGWREWDKRSEREYCKENGTFGVRVVEPAGDGKGQERDAEKRRSAYHSPDPAPVARRQLEKYEAPRS